MVGEQRSPTQYVPRYCKYYCIRDLFECVECGRFQFHTKRHLGTQTNSLVPDHDGQQRRSVRVRWTLPLPHEEAPRHPGE